MGLLKKYPHRMNLTACALKFMIMVGADLYIRPKVESSHQENCRLSCRGGFAYPSVNRRDIVQNYGILGSQALQNAKTAPRHQIMITVNEMDRMDCLYRRNALGRIYKSAPTVHGILFQQSYMPSRNATRSHKQNRTPPNSWEPKSNGAGRLESFRYDTFGWFA